MKPSFGRIGLLGILSILSLAIALAGLSGVSAQTAPTPVDYDDDNDGLIDATTLARLNAMRCDPRGSGSPSAADRASYEAAFPNPKTGMGCPSPRCKGYELRNDLTFDSNDNDVVDANDSYPNWTPIGDDDSPFRTTFEGNGHVISHLKVSGAPEEAGLFGETRGAKIRNLGLLEVDVSSTEDASGSAAGALAGGVTGGVSKVYATGRVSGASQFMGGLIGVAGGGALIKSSWANVDVSSIEDGARVGGLVGNAKPASVFAACAFGAVSASGATADAGGLVGLAKGASVNIRAACARGDVSATGRRANAGGLVGRNGATSLNIKASYSTGKATGATAGAFIASGSATVSDSYWDSTTSAAADDSDTASPEGKTTAELQTPTAASGIYANWDDLDLTDDDTANAVDDPWDFGTSSQYPAISFGTITASAQRDTDYDTDDDGFIDITALAHLNAMRYDLDGDGASPTDVASYAAAFPNALSDMGCPSAGCEGYELKNGLTFDTDGDGDVDSSDSYPNWTPIGDATNAFSATLKGNVKTISKMKISSAAARVGLFGAVSGSVKGVRLLDVDLTSSGAAASAGALAGANAGTISASSAVGTVSSTGTGAASVGGLTGESSGKIFASWARAAVSAAGAGGNVGGLVGKVKDSGKLTATHALGPVAGSGANANVGGLIGATSGTGNTVSASFSAGKITASGANAKTGGLIGSSAGTTFRDSYWDVNASGIPATTLTRWGYGKTTLELRSNCVANSIFQNWDDLDLTDDGVANAVDDPWDFGTTAHYPALVWGGQKADDQYDDYDADDDRLIDITALAQLNAMRYDPDGDGSVTGGGAIYSAAFPNARANMGCPPPADFNSTACKGYELQNDLTFDTDKDGDVDANDSYPNWTPIGTNESEAFGATFDGNGKTISKMKIDRSATGANSGFGLFGHLSGTVKGVGLLDADVNVTGLDHVQVGALAGRNFGTITASYATGKVSSAANAVGGLVGGNDGWIAACWTNVSVSGLGTSRTGGFAGINYATIVASYSRGDASSPFKTGGFAGVVGRDVGANVTASYSTGKVSSETGQAGGLVQSIWDRSGVDVDFAVNDSYWDADSSGMPANSDTTKGEGETTAALHAPTSATGIYANWDDLDLTNDETANPVDDPWFFGTNRQYPVLIWGGLRAEDQYRDRDSDDDGLIEIADLAQLDATRHDLNGDGSADSAAAYSKYAAAFPHSASGMGCPVAGCKGYELDVSLTFDTNGDGDVDNSDAYPNWKPIGDAANGFAAEFNGNGKTISKLKISAAAARVGLFGAIAESGSVKGVGLLEASITATSDARAGALAGDSAGTITSSYATGAVSSAATVKTHATGGLVGVNGGMIAASWAGVAVSSAGYQDSVGGLAGINYGKITAAYATGAVSSTGARSVAGGFIGSGITTGADVKSSYSTGASSATGTASTAAAFVGWGTGQIADSYWNATTSRAPDDADAASPEGKTTSDLQTPTAATGIYANWDDLDLTNDGTANAVDDPWDFGTSSQYPVLVWGDLKAGSQRQ